MAKTIKPELLGGFRDMPPAEALIQQEVISKIRRVYESFGFVPLDTPCMERWDVLTGGEKSIEKSIFTSRIVRGAEDKNVKDDSWEQNYTLRFDLTVPLARFIAAYTDVPKPFKRYQIGKVWRGEKPQAGRFREFYQFDFDIIGSRSIFADVEVIQVIYAVMKALSIENFMIRFNTRKVLNGLAQLVGYEKRANEVLRVIDKMDKIGLDGVLKELQRQPDNEFDESALAMPKESAEKVSQFLKIKADGPESILRQLEEFFGDFKGLGAEGLQELKEIISFLKELEIPEKNWRVDLSVARGLDYYTGPVFETLLTDMPKLGSVLSGGRFDGLTNRFIPDSNIPGVGASVGIDRLIVGMQKLDLVKTRETLTEVLVTVFDQSDKKLQSASLVFEQELRQQGFNTEIYLGEDNSLRAQFAYAAKKGIPFVVVIGSDELNSEKVQLKDMNARKQEALTKEECFAILQKILR